MAEKGVLDIRQIQECIPHRYPFLLLDRIVEFTDNVEAVGIKAVSANEPFFQGHFPGRPVMPGVLIIEAIAQVAAVMAKLSSDGIAPGKTVFLVGAQDVKFKRQVIPGDVLRIHVRSVKKRRPLWVMQGEVTVDGVLVASGTVSAAESD